MNGVSGSVAGLRSEPNRKLVSWTRDGVTYHANAPTGPDFALEDIIAVLDSSQ